MYDLLIDTMRSRDNLVYIYNTNIVTTQPDKTCTKSTIMKGAIFKAFDAFRKYKNRSLGYNGLIKSM